MIRTIADQWLAQNAGRRYPFADDAGVGGIPDSAVLDFSCVVHGAKAGEVVAASLTGLERVDGGMRPRVRVGAYGTLLFYVPDALARNAPYVASAASDDGHVSGRLTVAASLLSAVMPDSPVPFAATAVALDSLKVESVQADGGDVLTGEVVLSEGYNAEPYLDGSRLRLDVSKGGGLGEYCRLATGGGQTCDTVLFTVNGERPGSDGELRLVGGPGVAVTPMPDEHALEISLDATAKGTLAAECPAACGK